MRLETRVVSFTLANGTADQSGVPVFTLGGTDVASFAVDAGSCSAPLAPLTSCSFGVAFSPLALGPLSAFVDVSASDAGPQRVSLGGFGLERVGFLGDPGTLRDAGEFPNTAGPSGVRFSGRIMRLEDSGIVLDGFDLRNLTIIISANNVTLRNCLLDGQQQGFYTVQHQSGSGLTIEDCTFDGLGLPNTNANTVVSTVGPIVMRRNLFQNAAAGFVAAQTGVFENNVFRGIGAAPNRAPSSTTISLAGGSGLPVAITGNYLEARILSSGLPSAALSVQAIAGPIDQVLIDNNVVLGAQYNVRVTNSSATDGGVVTNVTVTNNRLGDYTLGPYNMNVGGTPVRTGNTHLVTGAAL